MNYLDKYRYNFVIQFMDRNFDAKKSFEFPIEEMFNGVASRAMLKEIRYIGKDTIITDEQDVCAVYINGLRVDDIQEELSLSNNKLNYTKIA